MDNTASLILPDRQRNTRRSCSIKLIILWKELKLKNTMSDSNAHNPMDDPRFFSALRTQMLQFAQLQLSDYHQAEDAVQEALACAIKNASTFSGKAAWKSWVFAILRHKIADTLRRRYSNNEISQPDSADEPNFDTLFDEKGHWPAGELPTRWRNPDRAMEQEQFWDIFELCLTHVPAHQARAFMMREFIGLETQEICHEMALTVTNLNVMLWRARMRLRECLSQRWFDNGGENAELS